MYDVSAQGVDERMIKVHYYYVLWLSIQVSVPFSFFVCAFFCSIL